MFSIPVILHGLLGTPGNLELRKRRSVERLAFNDVGFAGLVVNVDAYHTRDQKWRCLRRPSLGSLRRNLRADLLGDPVILSWHPRALGARRKELFILCLVEFYDK